MHEAAIEHDELVLEDLVIVLLEHPAKDLAPGALERGQRAVDLHPSSLANVLEDPFGVPEACVAVLDPRALALWPFAVVVLVYALVGYAKHPQSHLELETEGAPGGESPCLIEGVSTHCRAVHGRAFLIPCPAPARNPFPS